MRALHRTNRLRNLNSGIAEFPGILQILLGHSYTIVLNEWLSAYLYQALVATG